MENKIWLVWHTPLTSSLSRQRQADLCEFQVSLVYIVSSRAAEAKGRPCLKKTQTNQTNKKPHYSLRRLMLGS